VLVEEEMFLILCVYIYHSLCVCRVQKRKIVVGLISCIESRSIILLFESVFWLDSQGTSLIMNESFFAGSGTDG
jgi:hypothetical protein